MILRAKPTGLLARGYRFFAADREVGRLSLGLFGRHGTLEVEGKEFRVRREGLFGAFVLESPDASGPRELARATGAGPFSRTIRVRAGDRSLTLAGGPFALRTLRLRHGDREVGEARREGWLGLAAQFDFPPEIALEVRLFLAALAIQRWRRARAAAAG